MGHVVGVFFALSSAGGTDVSTQLHELFAELRAPGIQSATHRTEVGAVAAELNAQGHIVVFAILITHIEAGTGTTLTGFDTLETGVCVAVCVGWFGHVSHKNR